MRRQNGFTLIEIAIAVVIMMVVLAMAVPSVRASWPIAGCADRSMM